ncbi:unnamed protein product [Oppiella nova]|uniref:Uncharacterized protein n=1 Tax=Oppiella nova TaxID=334625 RepID=A0A7R9QAJ3_9ACAR|nr:unnamed protein product [Oppiella nova]CAG2161985.1 unnamed protein product [Oppiella nova]
MESTERVVTLIPAMVSDQRCRALKEIVTNFKLTSTPKT